MLIYQSEYNHASVIITQFSNNSVFRELGVDRNVFDHAVPIVFRRVEGQNFCPGQKDLVTQLRFTTRKGSKPVTMEEFDGSRI